MLDPAEMFVLGCFFGAASVSFVFAIILLSGKRSLEKRMKESGKHENIESN